MTFFHNLNKTLDNIAAKPEAAPLNERDMSRAAKGYEKYGKQGMEALAKAGREGKALDPIRKKFDRYNNTEVDEGLGNMARKVGSMAKKVGSKALDTLGHGSDADMIRDLQRKMGLPQTGAKPTEPKEGNEFSGELQKARAAGQKEFSVDGREYPVQEAGLPMTAKQKSFAALAEPKDKITFADKIAGAKKEVDEMLGDVAAEAMRSALGGGRGRDAEMDEEASQDNAFTAHKRPKIEKPAVGTITHGRKHDVEEIPGGRRVTRRTDAQGISVGADDETAQSGEKRGRGRPKGPSRAPERVTGGATKHKGGRKTNEGEVSTGNLQQMWKLVTGLKTFVQDPDGQALLKELTGMVKHYVNQGGEQKIDEKATSKKQQRFMGMVHAAQKGEKPASAVVAKTAKSMGKKDAEDFASTKHKGLPEKKKSDSKKETNEEAADNTEDRPKKSKSKFKFGGSVYENLDAQLETLITEGMSVSINMSQNSEDGQAGNKSITVSADGEDADRLAELLNLAGMEQHSDTCSSCGAAPCGCDMIDENSPDYPTDTETSDNALQYAGGLNGPKSTGQTTVPVIASQLRRQAAMAESARVEQRLLDLYRTFGK